MPLISVGTAQEIGQPADPPRLDFLAERIQRRIQAGPETLKEGLSIRKAHVNRPRVSRENDLASFHPVHRKIEAPGKIVKCSHRDDPQRNRRADEGGGHLLDRAVSSGYGDPIAMILPGAVQGVVRFAKFLDVGRYRSTKRRGELFKKFRIQRSRFEVVNEETSGIPEDFVSLAERSTVFRELQPVSVMRFLPKFLGKLVPGASQATRSLDDRL